MSQLCRISFLALTLIVPWAGTCDGSYIDYTYSTTLKLDGMVGGSGVDFAGLDGARIVFEATVDSNAVYIERFGNPVVLANPGATVTISGSLIAANNGTFALPQQAFYPFYLGAYAGFFLDPTSDFQTVALASGLTLTLILGETPTAHGKAVLVGDEVNILDFAPATNYPHDHFNVKNGTQYSYYKQVGSSINATIVPTGSVPEPTSLAMASLGLIGTWAVARRLLVENIVDPGIWTTS